MRDSRQAKEGRARGRPLWSRDHELGHSTGETRTRCDEQQGSSGTGLIMEVGEGAGMAWRHRGSLERPRRLDTGHLFLEGPAWSYRIEKRQRSRERSQKAKTGGIGLSEE